MAERIGAVVVLAAMAATGASTTARADECASFGNAAAYSVFSHGGLTLTGTTLAGRAAAAGDITVLCQRGSNPRPRCPRGARGSDRIAAALS